MTNPSKLPISSITVKQPLVAQRRNSASSSKTFLLVVVATSTALAIVLSLLAVILYRRRQLYGGLYLCSTPPLPDFIDKLDPSIALIDQISKLPYDEKWEFPREQVHISKLNILSTLFKKSPCYLTAGLE